MKESKNKQRKCKEQKKSKKEIKKVIGNKKK